MPPTNKPIIKSPFVVNQRVLSGKLCEELVSASMDNYGEMFSEPVHNPVVDSLVSSKITPNIEHHFGVKMAKVEITIESRGTQSSSPHICDSAVFSNGKWYRNQDIDFVTVVFLKDHLESVDEPIDDSFEVYGGKLEFPTFNFGFLPERGTAVTFPAVPNFLNTIAKVKIGQLDMLRIFYRSDTMFIYEPSQYSGSPDKWFADLI